MGHKSTATAAGRVALAVRTSAALKRRLERQAEKCEINMSDFCRRLLESGVCRIEAHQQSVETDRTLLLSWADQMDATLAAMAELGAAAAGADAGS